MGKFFNKIDFRTKFGLLSQVRFYSILSVCGKSKGVNEASWMQGSAFVPIHLVPHPWPKSNYSFWVASAPPVPAVVEIQLSDSTKKNLEMSGFNQVSFDDPSLSPSLAWIVKFRVMHKKPDLSPKINLRFLSNSKIWFMKINSFKS